MPVTFNYNVFCNVIDLASLELAPEIEKSKLPLDPLIVGMLENSQTTQKQEDIIPNLGAKKKSNDLSPPLMICCTLLHSVPPLHNKKA